MSEVPDFDDPQLVRALLKPFMEWDFLLWNGLPGMSLGTLNNALGQPGALEEVKLGWYPAQRYTYEVDAPSKGLAAYVRNGDVVLVEGLVPPPISSMERLGEPSAIKPHELLAEDAYVYEYLFGAKGLVISLAQPFKKGAPPWIVRYRGIEPIANVEQYGPAFYRSADDTIAW